MQVKYALCPIKIPPIFSSHVTYPNEVITHFYTMVINVYTSQCMMHFKKNNFKPGCVCTRKNCCFLCSSKKFKNLGSKQKWNKIFSCFTISHTRVLSVLISPLSTFSRQHINTVVKTTETTVKFTCIYIYTLKAPNKILWNLYVHSYTYTPTHKSACTPAVSLSTKSSLPHSVYLSITIPAWQIHIS